MKKRYHNLILESVMLHRASITPDNCYVSDTVILQLKENTNEHQTFCNAKVIYSNNSNTVKLDLEYGCIVIELSKVSACKWLIRWISSDMQRLTFGSSGKDLDDQSLLHVAIARLNTLLNTILEAGSQNKAVPGIINTGRSYWSGVEICLGIDDGALPSTLGRVGERCLNLYKNAKLGKNRRAAYVRKEESLKLPGSHSTLRVYNKSKQLESRYYIPKNYLRPNVFRIEFEVKAQKLTKVAGFQDREKLRTFSIGDLYKIFHSLHSEVKGVTFQVYEDLHLSRMEQVIAAVARSGCEVSIEALAEVGYHNSKSRSNALTKIRRHLESGSAVRMQTIFPPEYSPGFSVAALEVPFGDKIKINELEFQKSLNLVVNAYNSLSNTIPISCSTSIKKPLTDDKLPYYSN